MERYRALMEFHVHGTDDVVPVPDDLAPELLLRINRDRRFVLDPYADRTIAPERVNELRTAVESALTHQESELRLSIQTELRLTGWTPWAEATLQARLERNDLALVLCDLLELCTRATRQNRAVTMYGA